MSRYSKHADWETIYRIVSQGSWENLLQNSIDSIISLFSLTYGKEQTIDENNLISVIDNALQTKMYKYHIYIAFDMGADFNELREDTKEMTNNFAFVWSCSTGNAILTRQLLRDKNINIRFMRCSGPSKACKRGHCNVIKLLLKDNRFDPRTGFKNGNEFTTAICNNHFGVVKSLIDDKRIDLVLNKNVANLVKRKVSDIDMIAELASSNISWIEDDEDSDEEVSDEYIIPVEYYTRERIKRRNNDIKSGKRTLDKYLSQ